LGACAGVRNGWWWLMLPVMWFTGISNLKVTMQAMQRHLEGQRRG
jgi:hypothetical protein